MASDRSTPQGAPRYSKAQRRLLTVMAGLVVAVLAGGAFVLTYDILRELALEGRVSHRWAPVYPVMVDALTVMTLFSLVVSRHGRWWTRLLRWTLLLILLAGVAAIAVQRAVWGLDDLPDDQVKAGVAVAPHVMLLIAVWLWLTMFKQIRNAPARSAGKPAPVLEKLPATGTVTVVPPRRELDTQTTVEFDDPIDPTALPERAPRPELTAPATPAEAPALRATGPSATGPSAAGPSAADWRAADQPAAELPAPDEPAAGWRAAEQAAAEEPEREEPRGEESEAERARDHQAPALLPTDVELVRRPSAPISAASHAKTTRPDIVVPGVQDLAEDDAEWPVVERAEDPDAGDEDDPAGKGRHRLRARSDSAPEPETRPDHELELDTGDGNDDDLPIWDWNPPSGKFRSSPLPPSD
ncbi:DUF2637 domain-containing protein [Actinomadura barringtoniae]|uniref:DUF2637 domain-containing protein n=1 Tax=Actinomadura barringtoniae TaxID=1427535 RepID=A0A939PTK3_9ACTN|nr:DUF2637 domain-containing protein [Actinomadura barringtoniae]MBO2454819.1 DUF2637 domain-containing protein [Actinomadura barringtoniae]